MIMRCVECRTQVADKSGGSRNAPTVPSLFFFNDL